ncbi:MAG: NADPH-dependent FMN reductase [Alphaproteobacteria bacterium]|jgi:chromate reductase|nr:NADPH-dependent FMN reductase [Alphaproteobacteria bacterium]
MSYLLGLSGSLRQASTNTTLMRAAARIYDPAEFIEGDLDLPLYNGDVEDIGIPEKVQALSDQIAGAEAVVISCPEYNKALSGVMKNALDWVSRTKGNPWRDQPVAIMSATAGRAGGERSQSSLRLCLNPFRPVVIPGPEVLIAGSGDAFDENDELVNEASVRMLTDLMDQLRAMARG